MIKRRKGGEIVSDYSESEQGDSDDDEDGDESLYWEEGTGTHLPVQITFFPGEA